MHIKTQPKLLKRTLSTVIDYGLYLVFFSWFMITFRVPNDEGYTLSNDPKGFWILVVWFIYFPLVESIRGQTLGKFLVGLRVVSMNGKPISFGQAFKRHLLDMIELGLIAFIAIKYTPDHQKLGDLIARTIVIGGENSSCMNCHEELTLSADELVKGEFVCPECNATTKL